jgi:leucyl aminopeptidase
MAVGAGSENPPRLLILEYKNNAADKKVALVGKGVTFDSGGMNLKSGKSLAKMKSDMAGAAAVAAAAIAAAQTRPRLNIVALIPIVENMLSGAATRTGDVVRSYSGKTVEIGNTDAEGRLILADAISYAQEQYSPDAVIDLATLTGACVTALGEKIAGVFSNDDDLAEKILRAAEKTGEPCWRMPLASQYRKKLDSVIADINNVGKKPAGGAIVAALFLAEFVGNAAFAHIDIAGPSFIEKKSAYCGAGGTGFGVRLLCELFERL